MMELIVFLIVLIVALFWFSQLSDLLLRETKYFESHTHKLTWFLVIVSGTLIGAIWYYNWKRKAILKYEWRSKRNSDIQS